MQKPVNRKEIRRVVVLLAGSRTGSSFLFRALTSMGEFLAPTGEETPFYRKVGLGIFDGLSYSDAIADPPDEAVLDRLGEHLLRDVGLRLETCPDSAALANDFFSRLDLQWPESLKGVDRGQLWKELLVRFEGTPLNRAACRRFYLNWITDLHARGFAVEPDLFSASGAHPRLLPLLEEPPYITPEPRQFLTRGLAESHPLLLKTSTNAYRVPFLRALFPEAEFRWIVLRRNPAAATSALMDGWLSSAFHSHDLRPWTTLKIRGYSDRIPGGDHFWKFDMPPGWQAYKEASLAEVCAFQWQSAYQAIGAFLEGNRDAVHEVRYEEFLHPDRRREVLSELIAFSGTTERKAGSWNSSEPVVSVEAPLPGKWRKRAAEIEATLRGYKGGELLACSRSMGYDPEAMALWP